MIVYLPLAFCKFQLRLGWSLSQMLRLHPLNLFERRPLRELLEPTPP